MNFKLHVHYGNINLFGVALCLYFGTTWDFVFSICSLSENSTALFKSKSYAVLSPRSQLSLSLSLVIASTLKLELNQFLLENKG